MIRKNELRIGNWISDINASEKGMWQVKELRKSICLFGAYTARYELLRPIPLTAEILEMCGFVKENNGWTIGKVSEMDNDYFGLFDENLCKGKLDLKLNGAYLPMPKVKYLHQLQNLYFSLTGEELTVQEK